MKLPPLVALVLAAGCHNPATRQSDGGSSDGLGVPDAATPPLVTITSTVGSTRFVTREHMLASGEMQISGEPLAEAMGRDLGAYSRDFLPPDLYVGTSTFWIDIPGFSTAIESYEYSKQPMNNLAFEAGAGTSLVYGPLVDFDNAIGPAATAHMAALVQHYAAGSNALGKFVFPAGTFPIHNAAGDINPTGAGTPAANPLGWPGIWPTTHVFRSFDPTIAPTSDVALLCSITSDDTPGSGGGVVVCADYECDATTLHLTDRASQVDATITPGADGFSGWKYGLWVLNYLQLMHDVIEGQAVTVAASDLVKVGVPGNTVVGHDDGGNARFPGLYLGSSNIEGFQAQMFITELDNRAEDWLGHLSTTNGTTLTGFANLSAALAYDYTAALRWFPGAIAVTETNDGSGFPRPHYAISSADSDALDLIGLAMSYAELYALTDTRNLHVGASDTARVMFDGDPFAADDQLADGEPTVHDRALAMMRVALVDLDRLHGDPATGLLVDHVAMPAAARGQTISTTTVAYAVLGLRTVRRTLSSQLELYSNNTPDTAGTTTPLDTLPLNVPGKPTLTFSTRLDQMLRAEADLLLDHLTDATGRAWPGWNVAAAAPTDTADVLDAHTAAIRGLFAAYLATGDVRYRTRALAVFNRVETVFYDPAARIFSLTPAPVDSVEYTPLRFALLQSTLRDVYELVATRPGGETLAPVLEAQLGRLNKLVLNGWDDRDYDQRVANQECTNYEGQVPHGGLQMAERTLTGESGRGGHEGAMGFPTRDRDMDCVPEVDDAHLPAALADSVTFHIARGP